MCPRTGDSGMKKYMRLKLTISLQRSEPLTNYKEGKQTILFIILSLSFVMMYSLLEKKNTKERKCDLCVVNSLFNEFPNIFSII